jgi:hypothetical protein
MSWDDHGDVEPRDSIESVSRSRQRARPAWQHHAEAVLPQGVARNQQLLRLALEDQSTHVISRAAIASQDKPPKCSGCPLRVPDPQ